MKAESSAQRMTYGSNALQQAPAERSPHGYIVRRRLMRVAVAEEDTESSIGGFYV